MDCVKGSVNRLTGGEVLSQRSGKNARYFVLFSVKRQAKNAAHQENVELEHIEPPWQLANFWRVFNVSES
jgi:hypothetical protein